ncbi:RHS repeat-associated core domain-containing protein [Cronobacter dublinensis]
MLRVEHIATRTGEPVYQPLRYQGQYFDAETGLHYNRFRYYDPDAGCFISRDPIGLASGINVYLSVCAESAGMGGSAGVVKMRFDRGGSG